MNPERRQRIEHLYHIALARDADQRASFLAEACAGDEALRREVESLLAQPTSAEGFLAAPAMVLAAELSGSAGHSMRPGRRIGVYLLQSLLGAGGMGDVYRARDTKLGRDVAIKILPHIFTADPERLARFEREARVLASLNHPHIGAIYGLEESDGVRGLVLELVDGDTLAERLARGPLPVAEALTLARQIAEALEAAHEQGVVHRDLKPANIKVTPAGVVKVLDFGLAKLVPAGSGQAGAINQAGETGGAGEAGRTGGADLSASPTLTIGGTKEGLILGTVAYMSPEQARGQAVDKRTDIWAFGCVLYEMLTGRSVFGAQTISDTLARILEREPEWSTFPTKAPASVRRVVERCLHKDPKRRLRDIGDARAELEEPIGAILDTATEVRRRPWRRPLVFGVTASVLLASSLVVWRLRATDALWVNPLSQASITRFTDFEGDELDAAISPDGKFVAFLSDRDGQIDAWVGQVGSGNFINLTKGRFPALLDLVARGVGFSGDGTQVWVRGGGTDRAGKPIRVGTWLIPLMGGDARLLLDGGVNAAWSADGRHIASFEGPAGQRAGDRIMVADAEGRNPRQVYLRPGHAHYQAWSPDGRFVYFVAGLRPTEADIWRVPVDGGEPVRITAHNSHVRYPTLLDNRKIVYTAPSEDGSGYRLYQMDVERRIPHRLSLGVEQYTSIAASVDGRRLVASVSNPRGNLWTVPISSMPAAETDARLVPLPNVRAVVPRYGPGYLLYLSSKGGDDGLWKSDHDVTTELWKAADGAVMAAAAVSPDGQALCVPVRQPGKTALLLMTSDGTNVRQIGQKLDVRSAASWSPDSKWIAVAADEGSGVLHVFKISADTGEAVRLVAITRSSTPLWSPDGRFIVYSDSDALLTAIGPDGRPFELKFPNFGLRTAQTDRYRFTPDGKALVVLVGQYRQENFWSLNLQTMRLKQLTNLKPGFSVTGFDVSPDGKQIVFDRTRENSDIVLIDLAGQ